MELSVLVAEIKDEANRGTSITDAQVRVKVRDALTLIEQSQVWEYMRQTQDYTIDITGTPRDVALPSSLKEIEYFRITKLNGELHYVPEVNPKDLKATEVGLPEGYWKSNMTSLRFDNTPDENLVTEMGYIGYTTWSDADTFEPWVFIHMHALLKYQALVLLAPFLRDVELGASYERLRADYFNIASIANEESKHANQSPSMGYS